LTFVDFHIFLFLFEFNTPILIFLLAYFHFLFCLFLALIHYGSSILSSDFFICISSQPRLSNPHDDRQGFVGAPGPARWCGSPACFAAERPPPKVSFFRVFGPSGLQPIPQQSAPRLGGVARSGAGLVWGWVCGASLPRHAVSCGT
ncbi:MAG: hypothetical protein ACKO9A_13420, partial [Alphaproteobacteria bacterium]